MKKLSTLIFFLTISIFAFAQVPTFKWAKGVGSNGNDIATCTTTDSNGNVYVSGSFQANSITFGNTTLINSGLNGSGNIDFFLVKYDSIGQVIWAKKAGGLLNDEINSICTDNNGNVYITGYFNSPTITFENITITNNSFNLNLFIAKYNINGTLQWVKSWQSAGSGYSIGKGIEVNKNGETYFTGIYSGPSINFDSYLLTNSATTNCDVFITKIDSNGNVLWAKNVGGNNEDNGYSLALDNSDNIILAGSFRSTSISFGTYTLANINSSVCSIFLAKFDSIGNLIWAKRSGGNLDDPRPTLAIDLIGNLYLTGNYSNSITFTNTTLLGSNFFIAKFNNIGNFIWAKGAVGNSNASFSAGSITIDKKNNIYVSGTFSGVNLILGNDTLTRVGGGPNIFIANFDLNGSIIWTKSVGVLNFSYGINQYAITSFKSGDLYLVGSYYTPNVIFGNYQLINNGIQSSDLYITKLSTNFKNEILYNQTICKGNLPDNLLGSIKKNLNPSIVSTYMWIQSTTDSISNFTIAPGINNLKDYQPTILFQTTWFKRIVQTGSFMDTSKAIKIEVFGIPTSKFTVNLNTQCLSDNQFLFIDSSSVNGYGGINNYYWDFGDYTYSTIKNPIKTFYQAGKYTVRLVVSTNSLCLDTSSYQITVYDKQISSIYVIDTTQCFVNNTFAFIDTSTIDIGTITNRFWDFGDGTHSNLKSPIKSYAIPSRYNVKLITLSDKGCIDSTSLDVNVLNDKVGSIAGQSTNLIANSLYLYSVNQQLNCNYFWTVVNGVVVNGQGTNSIVVQWFNNLNGLLKCVSTNYANCNDTTSLIVNIGSTGININFHTNININPNPNPTNSIINISGLPEHELTSVNIYNTQGKLILSKDLTSSETIDLSSFPQGVYVFKIGEVVQRVVKL